MSWPLIFVVVFVAALVIGGSAAVVVEARRSGESFREVLSSVFAGWTR